jgi:mannose-6-phosphate isomerase-like protein (cupin superfamily)
MKILEPIFPQPPQQVSNMLAQPGYQAGTARICQGDWVPPQGYSSHPQNEFSVILSGELEVESGGQNYRVVAGQACLIPAHEAHRARAVTDTELYWILFDQTQ